MPLRPLEIANKAGRLVLLGGPGALEQSRTREMIFKLPELVAFLSRHVALEPGDLIFTGTPAGVGSVRTPRRYLAAGEQLETEIEGLGTLRNRCLPAEA